MVLRIGDELGFQIASFAARVAVILAVFAQADFKRALAEAAVADALAAPLRHVADHAEELLGHRRRLSRFRSPGNAPKVMPPLNERPEAGTPSLTPAKRG